jgi:hypothetical protein
MGRPVGSALHCWPYRVVLDSDVLLPIDFLDESLSVPLATWHHLLRGHIQASSRAGHRLQSSISEPRKIVS